MIKILITFVFSLFSSDILILKREGNELGSDFIVPRKSKVVIDCSKNRNKF